MTRQDGCGPLENKYIYIYMKPNVRGPKVGVSSARLHTAEPNNPLRLITMTLSATKNRRVMAATGPY